VKESEILKLFSVIQNTYNAFVFDRLKTELWRDLLQDTSFELAQSNLRRYILNPENRFPPHPGILAESPVQSCLGNYIPNAQETRLMLEERDRLFLSNGSSSIPESAKERMRQLGNDTSV
jgi:hypothetical protein